jgi:hypothetical protein
MARETEKIKTKLLDGSEIEVDWYTTISFPKLNALQDKLVILTKKENFGYLKEGEVGSSSVMMDLLKELWADTTYKVDQVDGTSFMEALMKRFSKFLGGANKGNSSGNSDVSNDGANE